MSRFYFWYEGRKDDNNVALLSEFVASVIDSCNKSGMEFVKSIHKPIKGVRNTMLDEYILFFRKRGSAEK